MDWRVLVEAEVLAVALSVALAGGLILLGAGR